MDNVFMNIYPSKPGNVNGSAMIAYYPEFSKTIKQCALLRHKYLSFFTEGVMLGDCVMKMVVMIRA